MGDKHLECPVFRPTLEEVRSLSFEEYVESVEPKWGRLGCCKIVAPDGWNPRRAGYEDLGHMMLPRPIRQHATGRQGLYRTLLVEQRSISLGDFREIAEEEVNSAPKADVETLERKFWRNIPMNPPLYGADVSGSLFDERLRGWNLKHLSSLLSRTLEANGAAIPGVTQPYLYVGSWRSFFAWHTEDMDLHSVNYLHHGAPKTWYVVPPAARDRFELLINDLLPELFRSCPEFLRHKEILLSPALLAAHNIPLVKFTHNPREFVVVGPGAYHAGFNHGYNIAESVNFATRAWVPVGARAGFCTCRCDSVKIDMRLFLDYMSKDLKAEVLDSYEDEEEDEFDDAEEESEEEEESDIDEGVSDVSSEEDGVSEEENQGNYHTTAIPPPLRLPAKRARKPSVKLLESSPELYKSTVLKQRKAAAAAAALPARRTTKNSRSAGRAGTRRATTGRATPTTTAPVTTRAAPLDAAHKKKTTTTNNTSRRHQRASPVSASSDDSDTRIDSPEAAYPHDTADYTSAVRTGSKRMAARAWYQLFDTLLPALKRART